MARKSKTQKWEISDFLKSSCRNFEEDGNNARDTNRLASIIMSKFDISDSEAYAEAAAFTGYNG